MGLRLGKDDEVLEKGQIGGDADYISLLVQWLSFSTTANQTIRSVYGDFGGLQVATWRLHRRTAISGERTKYFRPVVNQRSRSNIFRASL